MSPDRRDAALVVIGVVLVVVALVAWSTELGKAAAFVGVMLLVIAVAGQIGARRSGGPPTFGPPSGGPPF